MTDDVGAAGAGQGTQGSSEHGPVEARHANLVMIRDDGSLLDNLNRTNVINQLKSIGPS